MPQGAGPGVTPFYYGGPGFYGRPFGFGGFGFLGCLFPLLGIFLFFGLMVGDVGYETPGRA